MYFKQLEIVGFKSFPHKTKLKFEPGVTAVVGPNGCGKSNISDAIRWVLGEQSPRSLRGSSMEDVIFNGTDSIPPINMAEVSLTLSNEDKALPIDYDEVTITRRLFRSGESEYVLNKTDVRLKDISNLLIGTGMGTNSYSIIEQGKIDRILSSKPEDRRYIFEEASGITRYKSKKIEALRKLEHTESNLVRINDIITEVKRQINSIERHAKKAERYKIDFEAMKDLDLKLAAYELENINSELEKNKKALEEDLTREKDLRLELEGEVALIDDYREKLEGVIRDLTDVQAKLSDTSLFIEKGRHKAELNGERVNDLVNMQTAAEKEVVALKEKITLAEAEIAKIKERFLTLKKTREDKERSLAEKESRVSALSAEIEAHQKDIKSANNKLVDIYAFQTKTKNELIKMGADLGNRKSRLRRLETEKANVAAEKESAECLFSDANKELEAKKEKVRRRTDGLEGLKVKLGSCEQLLEDARKKMAEKESALNSLNSKEEILRAMMENFEGFDRGVKLVMGGFKGNNLRGIMGIVADMFEPTDGYELALEAALGKKAEAIVVENKSALDEALIYLGRNNASAQFIIYEDIKGKGDSGRYEAALSNFVRENSAFPGIAEYLLGGTFMADDVETAYGEIKKHAGITRFVTKDGFLVEKGYVFGGFLKNDNAASIIGRAKRLDGIAKEKRYLAENIEALRNDASCGKKRVEEVKSKISLAENELKKEEIELANVLSKKASIEANLKKINDELSIVELEISEVDELIHDISLKGEELNTRLNECESEHASLTGLVASSQEAIQNKTKLKNNLIFEISDIKSEAVFLKKTEDQEEKGLEKETGSLDEIKAQYNLKEETMRNCREKISLILEETKALEEEISRKESEEAELKKVLGEITEKRKTISKDLHDKEAFSREREAAMEEMRNGIRNLEIKEREGELKAVNIKDRVREAYKIEIQTALIQFDDSTNWEEARNEIEVLRIKLDKLGPVNLVAIEEHKELEERYAFLAKQQEDLLMAKESLHKAIVKINKTTRSLFLETFEKIQAEFKGYFRMLFGGGHAELLLLDETDVLECGIEIVARPPGKKLQNLLLLSGGEKALTAIALLFAIFKVKPSPFCILDEVDAPLDESNIGRFTRILQEFLKMSQFIVITHSKRTMQMANILYGITMEEKGVSKIVSVKFADDKKEAPSAKEEVLV